VASWRIPSGGRRSREGGDRAVFELVSRGRRAIPPLRPFLLEGKPSRIYQPRCWTVEVLAMLGVKDVLAEYLLAKEKIVDPVVEFEEEAVQDAAARELARWRTREVFAVLVERARRRITPGVVEALKRFARPEIIPYLDKALEDNFCQEAA